MLAMAATVACNQEEPVVTPELDLNKTTASVDAEGGSVALEVTSNVDWTASADPAVKETIWAGDSFDLGSDWSQGLQINSVPRLPEDARIHVVYEAPAGYDYYQFKFCYIDQNWGWNAMTSPVDVNEYGCVMLDPQKTEYVLALNDEDIAAINAGKGMVIQEYGAVITKVSYK